MRRKIETAGRGLEERKWSKGAEASTKARTVTVRKLLEITGRISHGVRE